MTDDIRDTLARALCAAEGGPTWWDDSDSEEREMHTRTAERIEPVIRGLIADHLEAAADDLIDTVFDTGVVKRYIHRRAAAIRSGEPA
jgi:hypothetical protein